MGLLQPGLWLKRVWILLQVALHVTLGKVQLKLFPGRVKQHILAMNRKNPHFSYDNWAPTLFSTQYFWFILKVRWQRLEDKTEEGGLAPNCPVVHLSGQRCNIWDFMQAQKTFMSTFYVPGLQLYARDTELNGWAFKNNVVIRNHRNLQDRLQAAHLLLDRSPRCPVVVDTMKNQSSQLYAALPDRLYVLQEGRILYKGKPGPWNYHPEEVRAVLEKLHS